MRSRCFKLLLKLNRELGTMLISVTRRADCEPQWTLTLQDRKLVEC